MEHYLWSNYYLAWYIWAFVLGKTVVIKVCNMDSLRFFSNNLSYFTISKSSNVMSGEGKDMSFFVALDIVIAMPISWMPLVSDYNRFAKTSKGAFIGTLIGFSITNIIFYVGGLLFGVGDISSIIISIQAIPIWFYFC